MNKKTRESIIPVAITIAIIIIIRIVIQIWNNQIRNSKDDYKQYNNIEITVKNLEIKKENYTYM